VLASKAFAGAKRSCDLLRFLVETMLAGRADRLKEYTVGAEGLGRGERFDPQFDSIARVEASRLRTRLAIYYATEGRTEPVVVNLPTGGYVPVVVQRDQETSIPTLPTRNAFTVRLRDALLVSLGVLIAAAGFVFLSLSTPKSAPSAFPASPPMRMDVALGAPGEVWTNPGLNLALSRDGRMLVMSIRRPDGTTRLYARPTDSLVATEIPGTDDASSPFLSPDGRWVAFFSGGELKKTLVDGGGSPVPLASGALAFSIALADDGQIIASLTNDGALWRIPADGGAPVRIIDLGPDGDQPRWPSLLPDGKGLLFTASANGFTGRLEYMRLDGTGRKPLLARGVNARYLPTGHIIYTDGPQLFVVKFDLDRLEVIGAPRKVVDDIAYLEFFGIAPYAVSDDGTLVYVRGGPGQSVIEQIDDSGRSRPLAVEPARRFFPRLSPDGSQLVFTQADGADYALWSLDMKTGRASRFSTEPGGQTAPAWSSDGRYVFYFQGGARGLAARRADGSGDPKLLLRNVPGNFWNPSPDGRSLVFQLNVSNRQLDLWTVPIAMEAGGPKAGEPHAFFGTKASETQPAYSPDGRWVAYSSNIAGQADVYVRPASGDGAAVIVSAGPGSQTRWSKDGQHLFYETRDRRLMSVRYHVDRGAFRVEPPVQWSERRLANTGVFPNYDLAPDGRSIVALVPAASASDPPRDHVTVVRNFFQMLP
jgi:serine/threonine-protein kinase